MSVADFSRAMEHHKPWRLRVFFAGLAIPFVVVAVIAGNVFSLSNVRHWRALLTVPAAILAACAFALPLSATSVMSREQMQTTVDRLESIFDWLSRWERR